MPDPESLITSSKHCSDSVAQQPPDEMLNGNQNQSETLYSSQDKSSFPSEQSWNRATLPSQPPPNRRSSKSHSFCDPSCDPKVSKKTRGSKPGRYELPRINKQSSKSSIVSAECETRTLLARERRPSRSSVDSEIDSHASRSSQETEEDVCFPMLREHVRINGIDFDEIEDFINEERENQRYARRQGASLPEAFVQGDIERRNTSIAGIAATSKTNLKHIPTNDLAQPSHVFEDRSKAAPSRATLWRDAASDSKASDSTEDAFAEEKYNDTSSDNVQFGKARLTSGGIELPDGFSFFHSDNKETIHSPSLSCLIPPGATARGIFKNGEGTWWLDCTCPTDAEMKTIAKAFGIHPLTAEDIRMQESREKVELFRNYYFVCFHTFEHDKESEEHLEPIFVYIVVFREGVLTFHFSPVSHAANVRRRVRQLRDYVDVSADWIGYAMIDDITDGFAPVITAIEHEADAIEDSVFEAASINFSYMLRKTGESRRKVMTLMRLLSNKADVIRMFAKRCQDEACVMHTNSVHSRMNLAEMAAAPEPSLNASPSQVTGSINFGPPPGAYCHTLPQKYPSHGRVQPRADIALYLGDIQDHVVTMFQNLSAYEKIFSRSHANYLAQLQVESFNANLTVTKILSKVTMIGTMFLPLSVVTSLFGMNVKVLGDGEEGWFWGIIGFLIIIALSSFAGVRFWLRKMQAQEEHEATSKKSVKSLSFRGRTKDAAKSILSFPNKYD